MNDTKKTVRRSWVVAGLSLRGREITQQMRESVLAGVGIRQASELASIFDTYNLRNLYILPEAVRAMENDGENGTWRSVY